MVCIEIHKYKYSVVMTTQPLFILVIDHGDSSDDVNGSGSLSIKWKYETDNGTGIQLGWGRGGGGEGGRRRLTGVQYSLYLHMSTHKNVLWLEILV